MAEEAAAAEARAAAAEAKLADWLAEAEHQKAAVAAAAANAAIAKVDDGNDYRQVRCYRL